MKNKKFFLLPVMVCFFVCIIQINAFAAVNAITTGGTTFRTKAGVVYPSIKTVNKGTELEVIGKELNWYKVKIGEQVGFINDKSVDFTNINDKNDYNPIKPNYEKLATYKTTFGLNDKNRNHNIELSAGKNSIVLKSGESFSFNKNTGNSTLTSSGWQISGVIVNKKYTKGVGGGICQTSSTLYSAIKTVANIKILQRAPHSVPVGYVPVSGEATVSYGSQDLRFRNDNAFDIFIYNDVNQNTGTLTTTVYKIDKNKSDIWPTSENPKPINTNELAKKAYIQKLKDIEKTPAIVFNTLKLTNEEILTSDLSFVIDDLDGDGINELVMSGIVTTRTEQKETVTPKVSTEQPVQPTIDPKATQEPLMEAQPLTESTTPHALDTTVLVAPAAPTTVTKTIVKTYNYYLVYSYQSSTGNVVAVKSFSSLENNKASLYKLNPYKEKSTGAISWFILKTNTDGVSTLQKINKGYVLGDSIKKAEFDKNYSLSSTNSTKLKLSEITAFGATTLEKPKPSPNVVVNGTIINYNLAPRIIDGSTYIEMRSLFESLDYTVGYDETTKSISMVKGDNAYFLENGFNSTVIKHVKNGETKEIPVTIPIKLVDERTIFPLRFAGDLLNYNVSWDEVGYTASLDSK